MPLSAALDTRTLDEWADWLRPSPAELEWRGIPWRATLADAIGEARKRSRPVLLWAMNGHPLGCT
jgi:hypothetical protein